MKCILLLFFSLLLNVAVISQTLSNKNNFTSSICSQEENRELTRSLADKIERLLFIGEYEKAMQINDIYEYLSGSYLGIRSPLVSSMDSIKRNDYSLAPAKQYIIDKSKKEQIVIINEAHKQPLHRVFTRALLKEMYMNGFRYFAVETLDGDSLLNFDKYPKLSSGYYSSEPQYGEMIREALLLGYTLVAYEDHINIADWKKREHGQAINIKKKTMDINPNAKVIVHCGYGHGIKNFNGGEDTLMGGWVKALTGISPLIIDQTTLEEHSREANSSDFYNTVALNCNKTSVLTPKGFLYNLYKKTISPDYDIDVIHPSTKFIYGRPDWLNLAGDKKYYFPNEDGRISISYPINVKAFYINEITTEAVPADCIELLYPDVKKALVLKPGKYILYITNERTEVKQIGNEVQQLEIEIK
jgi:hypothetical protein